MLNYAEKYNWWTPQEKKEHISDDAKIQYVLSYGTLSELRQALKDVGGKKLYATWKKYKNILYTKQRQHVVEYFVTQHRYD